MVAELSRLRGLTQVICADTAEKQIEKIVTNDDDGYGRRYVASAPVIRAVPVDKGRREVGRVALRDCAVDPEA